MNDFQGIIKDDIHMPILTSVLTLTKFKYYTLSHNTKKTSCVRSWIYDPILSDFRQATSTAAIPGE